MSFDNKISISEITENLRLISTFYHDVSLNLVCLSYNNKVILFDTSTSSIIKNIIEDIGTPNYSIVTHSHPDHAGGSGVLSSQGSTIISTPLNKAFLFDKNVMLDSFFPKRFRNMFDKSYVDVTINEILTECPDPHIDTVIKPSVNDLKLINAPGHTSSSLFIRYKNILFTSDGIQGTGIVGTERTDSIPQIWSIGDYLLTLHKIKNYTPDILIPGHNFMPYKNNLLEGSDVDAFINASEDYVYKLLDISMGILEEPLSLKEFVDKLLIKTGHTKGIYPQAFITAESILDFLKHRISIMHEGDIETFQIL